jgi:hypothetical protein
MSKYQGLPIEEVKQDAHFLGEELAAHDRNGTLPQGGYERLQEQRREQFWMQWELATRKYEMGAWMPFLVLLGLFLFFSERIHLPKRKQRKNETKRNVKVQIPESPASEEYVDEFEFERKREAGFLRRDDAVDYLLADPALNCDYCGGQLMSSFEGDREALQHVTFYKKVPEGARDLRVVLGSYWFARAAAILKCKQCQRVLRR